ncbi:hypothetical protein BDW02DRAFT_635224 [Decorospora gaudefroyi]|uniref:Uncharacterized protein n=1 Tax=Decorospora gaudefroyi TaxID=184978 RepID=A0A6A5K2B7_9PLEO|nr:hypothetical protein BDW02DRAFT_635224 [Decorospora gaudefroyi]
MDTAFATGELQIVESDSSEDFEYGLEIDWSYLTVSRKFVQSENTFQPTDVEVVTSKEFEPSSSFALPMPILHLYMACKSALSMIELQMREEPEGVKIQKALCRFKTWGIGLLDGQSGLDRVIGARVQESGDSEGIQTVIISVLVDLALVEDQLLGALSEMCDDQDRERLRELQVEVIASLGIDNVEEISSRRYSWSTREAKIRELQNTERERRELERRELERRERERRLEHIIAKTRRNLSTSKPQLTNPFDPGPPLEFGTHQPEATKLYHKGLRRTPQTLSTQKDTTPQASTTSTTSPQATPTSAQASDTSAKASATSSHTSTIIGGMYRTGFYTVQTSQ